MTHFQAYLLTRLDSFQHLFDVFVFITFVLFIANLAAQFFSFILCSDEEDKNKKANLFRKIASYFKITGPLAIATLVISSLIPTTKEAAFIYIAPAIVNNQDIQKTINKLPELSGLGLEYLGKILKQEIKETKGEVINEVKKSIK